MGYAFYTLPDGREAGYAVKAICDAEGCDARIDRADRPRPRLPLRGPPGWMA